MTSENFYITSNTLEAAFLKASGYSLVKIDREEIGIESSANYFNINFYFDTDPRTFDSENIGMPDAFIESKSLISPRQVIDEHKNLTGVAKSMK